MEKETKNPDATSPNEMENINKIRDILFGNNIAEIDKKFQKIESELNNSISILKENLSKDLQSFETFFKEELNALTDKIQSEKEARESENEKLQKQIDKINNDLLKLKDDLQSYKSEMRNKTLENFKETNRKISTLENEFRKNLLNEVNALSNSKLDRKTLAIMLSDIALKIGEDESEQ